MADLSYSIGIDTAQAQRSLDALRNTIAGFGAALASAFTVREIVNVSSRFEELRITLQTLYRDIDRGAQVFDDIKQFAKTSAFAVEDLTQTVIKLKTAGLEPNIALLRLFADVSGSVADKLGALQAITDLYARTQAGGLGLEDLNRLADRGIPVFTILQEKLGLSRLEITKIGQSAQGAQLILQALEAGLAEAFSGATANKANTLGQAISNFKDTLNNLIDILGQFGFNQSLANFINTLGKALENLTPYIAVIGTMLSDAFRYLAENIDLVTKLLGIFLGLLAVTAIAAAAKVLLGLGRAVIFVASGFGLLNSVLAKNPLIKALQVLGILGAGFAVADMTGQFDALKKSYEDLVKTIEVDLGDALKEQNSKKIVEGLPLGQLGKDTGNFKDQVSALNTELNKFRAEMKNLVDAYGRQLDSQRKSFTQQTELIGATEEQRIAVEELRNAHEGYLSAIQPLLDDYAKLSASSNKEDLAKLPLIQQALIGVTKAYEDSLGPLRESVKLRIDRLMVERELTYQADLLARAEQRRLDIDQSVNELLLRGPREAKQATDTYINSTLTPLQRRLAEIRQEEIRLRDATLQRIAEQMGDDPASAEAYARAVEQIYGITERNIQIRQSQAQDEIRYQQTFTAGWNKAFREYAQSAADASKRGAALFNKTVQGMEDLFVNFAKTGKFQWKNFLNDLGEALLRSQLQQLFAGIFGDMTTAMDSGKGFMGVLGQLLGFGSTARGSSAQNPMYVIDLASVKGGVGVGANQGGGFFDTLLGGIKNIGSSIWDGVKNIGSSILGAIGLGGGSSGGGFFSSIVKGIGSLFGGFFANGGTLGAGRWGIAGERGPELITGPATITPMGGASYVTYNIQALDALSFKQMIARDPSFIHAVAQQGSKGITRRY